MESLAKYRLNDFSYIEFYQERMGIENFRKYRNDVFIYLENMKVGEKYSIEAKVKKENFDLFIKIVCTYILYGKPNYSFTNDYKHVKRNA